jgi:NMD protein affecting ribosome stability and mRNA decay
MIYELQPLEGCMPFALKHIKCGKIAFYFKKRPVEGITVMAEDCFVISPVAHTPQNKTYMFCESCGGTVSEDNLCDDYLGEEE